MNIKRQGSYVNATTCDLSRSTSVSKNKSTNKQKNQTAHNSKRTCNYNFDKDQSLWNGNLVFAEQAVQELFCVVESIENDEGYYSSDDNVNRRRR